MNAAGFPILSLITWLPLIGCVVIMSVRGDEATVASNARWTALWTSLLVLALSLVLWVKFDPREPGFQFNEFDRCLGLPSSFMFSRYHRAEAPPSSRHGSRQNGGATF